MQKLRQHKHRVNFSEAEAGVFKFAGSRFEENACALRVLAIEQAQGTPAWTQDDDASYDYSSNSHEITLM